MEIKMVLICAFVLAISITLVFYIRYYKLRRNKKLAMDDMDGIAFEKYCAKLLEKQGFDEIETTRASGDFGVDIVAQKDGITYAFQCKCYSTPVGVHAIQEIYMGRDYYDCMIGVVMTNEYFTQPAVDAASKLKILLWDRGYLDRMIEENEE